MDVQKIRERALLLIKQMIIQLLTGDYFTPVNRQILKQRVFAGS
jgi:hypothetical protein